MSDAWGGGYGYPPDWDNAGTGADNTTATSEPDEPPPFAGEGGKSVWFFLSPPAGLYELSAWGIETGGQFTGGHAFDTNIEVFTGSSIDALTRIAGATGSGVVYVYDVPLGPDQTYWVRIDSVVAAEAGFLNFGFGRTYIPPPAPPPAPANDHFAGAEVITGTSGGLIGTNVGATIEGSEPAPYRGSGGHSIWYQWTAPSAAGMEFDTIGTGFDTVLDVFTGSSVGALTRIIGDDDAGGSLTSKVVFTPVSGTTYHLRVDGYGSGGAGAVHLNWGLADAPPPPEPEAGWMIGAIAMTSNIG